MSRHIKFDGFDCVYLQYIEEGKCWVCLKNFFELSDVDFCFRCKFARQLEKERLIREGKINV